MEDQQRSTSARRSRPPPPPPSAAGIDDQRFGGIEEISQEIGTSMNCSRAKWNHRMKLYLVGLLKDHDIPRYRTQNAWSKEAWTSIVGRFNLHFALSFTQAQVKQKEQDLKKEFKVVKDLLAESGFGWDLDRKMVVAPDDVWAALRARKNRDALQWQDKSFPYYEDLSALYGGRYAQGRSCHGMDQYANKARQSSQLAASYSPPLQVHEVQSHSPSPNTPALGESSMYGGTEEGIEGSDWFSYDGTYDQVAMNSTPEAAPPASAQAATVPVSSQHEPQARPSNSTPEVVDAKRGKKHKANPNIEDFHERYLRLKREEIDRFAAIEEKKLEDPFSISKCITTVEKLQDLQIGDMLKAADIFTDNKANREVFLSFSSDELRLAWLIKQIQ